MQRVFPNKHWYLKHVNLFSDLSDEEIKLIDSMIRMEYIPKQQPIYIPGEGGDNVYLLKQGHVKISRLMEDGRELTLTILEPGEIFGEIEALMNATRNTQAVALDDSYICIIRKEDFESFLKKRPDTSIKLTKLIGIRLMSIENRIDDILYKDVPTRLASLLLKLADQFGHVDNAGVHLQHRLTHQELANLIASTRETVSRTLGEFRKKRLVEYNRKEIIIKDKNGLSGYL